MIEIKNFYKNNLPLFFSIIFLILFIFFELSLTKIFFFYETPPSLFLILFFLVFFVFKISIPTSIIFCIGLIYDFLLGTLPGMFCSSILISTALINQINRNYLLNSYFTIWFFFLLYFSLVSFFQTIFYFMLFLNIPNIDKIIFQLGLSLFFFPLVYFFLKTIINFSNLKN